VVIINLTNGFGNNLFQYTAARLLAEHHEQELLVIPPSEDYYAIKDLTDLGVDFSKKSFDGQMAHVSDHNYRACFEEKYKNVNFNLRGYFEDYILYRNDIQKIKSWFPEVQKRTDDALVIHFRAGDRLFYKNEFDTKPTIQSYINALDRFNFSKLYIVTDMPAWEKLSENELNMMKFHYDVPSGDRVPISLSVEYFNSFVDGFAKYEPLVVKGTICEDFNFIRTFDNILFQHGTLGWWAAILSEASKVGVYGPWRPWKGRSNKNLSNINIEGWFQWK